jgi:hypothetical protein
VDCQDYIVSVIDEWNTHMSKECWWIDTDRDDPVLNLIEMFFTDVSVANIYV